MEVILWMIFLIPSMCAGVSLKHINKTIRCWEWLTISWIFNVEIINCWQLHCCHGEDVDFRETTKLRWKHRNTNINETLQSLLNLPDWVLWIWPICNISKTHQTCQWINQTEPGARGNKAIKFNIIKRNSYYCYLLWFKLCICPLAGYSISLCKAL